MFNKKMRGNYFVYAMDNIYEELEKIFHNFRWIVWEFWMKN